MGFLTLSTSTGIDLGAVFMSFVLDGYHHRVITNCSSIDVVPCDVQGICLVPKRRVDRLSGAFEVLGEQQHSNAALELPPCKQ